MPRPWQITLAAAGLALAVTLSPRAASAAAAPSVTLAPAPNSTATVKLPLDGQECAALKAARPEYAMSPCVLTMTTSNRRVLHYAPMRPRIAPSSGPVDDHYWETTTYNEICTVSCAVWHAVQDVDYVTDLYTWKSYLWHQGCTRDYGALLPQTISTPTCKSWGSGTHDLHLEQDFYISFVFRGLGSGTSHWDTVSTDWWGDPQYAGG